MGSTLSLKAQKELINLLKEFQELFSWSYKDMLGIDPNIAQHCIPTLLDIKPVKKKMCCMKPDWLLKIKEEVIKQLKAKLLKSSVEQIGSPTVSQSP